MSPTPPVAGVLAEEVKREVGRAMNITPIKATNDPSFSVRVKGSLMRIEQAQHERDGARNVMTVASDKGR